MSGNGKRTTPDLIQAVLACPTCHEELMVKVPLKPGQWAFQLPYFNCAACDNFPRLVGVSIEGVEKPSIIVPTLDTSRIPGLPS